jgi:hypothetical protein
MNIRYALIPTLLISLNAAMPKTALAAPINGNVNSRSYVVRRYPNNNNSITAAKAVLNGGWNSLSTGPVSGNPVGRVLINKDIWLQLDEFGSIPKTQGCWIEAMVIDTKATAAYQAGTQSPPTFTPDFRGYMIATQISNSPSVTTGNMKYTEYAFSSVDPDPAAQTGGTIEIVKTPGSTNAYKVNINNVNGLNLTNVNCRKIGIAIGSNQNQGYPAIGGSAADFGIESNDTANTFTSGTSMDVLVKDLGQTVYSIPATTFGIPTNAPPSWTTTYNTTNGRVTMTR